MKKIESVIFAAAVVGLIAATVFVWFLLYWQEAPV